MAASFDSWLKSAYVNHTVDGALACHLRAAWDAAEALKPSHNSAMVCASQIAAFSEIEGKLNHAALMLNSLAGTVNELRRQLHQ